MRRAWCAQRLSRKYVQKKICPHRCSHWLTRSQYMPSQHNQENVSFACVRVPGLGTFPDPTHSRDHVRKEKGYPGSTCARRLQELPQMFNGLSVPAALRAIARGLVIVGGQSIASRPNQLLAATGLYYDRMPCYLR